MLVLTYNIFRFSFQSCFYKLIIVRIGYNINFFRWNNNDGFFQHQTPPPRNSVWFKWNFKTHQNSNHFLNYWQRRD